MPKGWKALTAPVPSFEAMMKPYEEEMAHYLDIVEKRFKWSVATWDKKPSFTKDVKRIGALGTVQSVVGQVYTEDQVYFWLNEGTSVRYATMTPNFKAKTKPGRIRARSGAGGVAYVNRLIPRPGIKPRKWDELIAQGTMRNLVSAFIRAVKKSVKASGHAI